MGVDPQLLARAAEVAEAAADAARAEIEPRFRDVAVETKSDGSPVTEADRAAERAIRAVLTDAFPDHHVLGEEYGEEGEAGGRPTWVIDPIDGTVAFSRGIPLYSTLIALAVEGEPVLGLIDLPGVSERYLGWQGAGCRRNGQPVRVSPVTDIGQALAAHGDDFCFKLADQLPALAWLREHALFCRTYTDAFGHSLALSGAVDVVVDCDLAPWDWMASAVLAREAGGACVVRPGRRPGKSNVALGSGALVEQAAAALR